MKFHDTLNEKIWDLNTEDLIPEVKEKLEEIADTFIEFLEIPTDAVLDKVITGSSASYNYNEFSDLDLHIIVDYDKVHEDCPLVNGYLNSLKKQFNDNHDITIHGVPVELYAEQKDQGTVHNGLYSLQTGWIDKPQKIEPTDNDAAVEAKYNEIKELVDKCDDSEEATELLDKIYTMRKAGLAEAGEFCTENLAFKKLRNEGCMDKLRQIKKEQIDKQLSLESYNEEEKTFGDYFYSFNHTYTLDRWFLIHCFDGYKPKEYKSIEISHPESNNGIIIQNKGEKRTKDKGNFFYLLDLGGKAKNIDSPEITATIYQEKVWIPDNITNDGIGGALKTFCKNWSNTNRYANGHTEYYIELFDLTLDKACKESKAIEQFLKQFENLLQNIDDRVTWEKANSNTVNKNESIKEDYDDIVVYNAPEEELYELSAAIRKYGDGRYYINFHDKKNGEGNLTSCAGPYNTKREAKQAMKRLRPDYIETEAKNESLNKLEETLKKVEDMEINEGMWASPFTMENAKQVAELLSKPITYEELNSEEGKQKVWNIIGDDKFWDNVADEALDNPEEDARYLIVKFLEDWMERKESFNDDAYSQEAENIIKKAIFMFNGITEDMATLEKKVDTADNDLHDIITSLENTMSEALKE